jgi:hypothetical protein
MKEKDRLDYDLDRQTARQRLQRHRFRDEITWMSEVLRKLPPEFYIRRFVAAGKRRGLHRELDAKYRGLHAFQDRSFTKLSRRLERDGEIERVCKLGVWKVRLTAKGQALKEENLRLAAMAEPGTPVRLILDMQRRPRIV